MQNGELDSKGLLATLVKSEGTIESFKVGFWYESGQLTNVMQWKSLILLTLDRSWMQI